MVSIPRPDYEGETYRAIGHYVVQFAALIDVMRSELAEHLNGSEPQANPLPYIVMGEMTAQPIANSFFGACREVAELNAEDELVAKVLSSRVSAEIKVRNDIAHGDWTVNAWRFGRTPPGTSELHRLRPARKAGFIELIQVNAKELEARCNELEALASQVLEYSLLCFGVLDWEGYRVSDVFTVEDKVVHRNGRRAANVRRPARWST
jgi:hypothetical protein